MRKLLNDDRGLAMVTAVLALMVVTSLATAGFSLATHDLNSSAGDRRRTQAIHAAEAGLDRFLQYLSLPTTSVTAPACGANVVPNDTTLTPASFSVTATYYTTTTAGSQMTCTGGVLSSGITPGAVLIHSVGTAAGVTRTMDGWYAIASTPGQKQIFGGAIYAFGDVTIQGQGVINGPSTNPNGGDIYSAGNVALGGSGNGDTINGKVWAAGTLTLKGGTEVKLDAISKGDLTTSGGATVDGNVRSSMGALSLGNNTAVFGNGLYCTGSAPSSSAVKGTITKTTPCDPTVPNIDTWGQHAFVFDPVAAANNGYTVKTYTGLTACASAQAFIPTIPSGAKYVIRIQKDPITGLSCQLSYTSTVTVNGDLEIVSDGTLSLGSQALITSPVERKLILAFDYSTAGPPCANQSITLGGQASISTNLDTLMYTPCQVSFNAGSNTLKGQIVSAGVSLGGHAQINTYPILVETQSGFGFAETMLYRREVIS